MSNKPNATLGNPQWWPVNAGPFPCNPDRGRLSTSQLQR
jgi:hypothetical protein